MSEDKPKKKKKVAECFAVDISGRKLGLKTESTAKIDGDIQIVFKKGLSVSQLRQALALAAVRIK